MSTPATIIVKPCSMIGLHGVRGDAEDADRNLCLEARVPDAPDGIPHLGMIDGAGTSEAGRQIVWSDQDSIHAVDPHDLADLRDGITMLRLDDDGGLVVGSLHVLSHVQAVAVCPRDAEPALAGGGVLRGLDDALCVLDGVDLRRDDAGGADVERPLHVQIVAGRQPDHAGRGAGALHQRLHLRRIERRVLRVDEQPVESHLGEQLGYRRGIQCDERRDQALARPQSRTKGCRHLMNSSARAPVGARRDYYNGSAATRVASQGIRCRRRR